MAAAQRLGPGSPMPAGACGARQEDAARDAEALTSIFRGPVLFQVKCSKKKDGRRKERRKGKEKEKGRGKEERKKGRGSLGFAFIILISKEWRSRRHDIVLGCD